MPEYSRPREKLRERGATALTDEELVATKGFTIFQESGLMTN